MRRRVVLLFLAGVFSFALTSRAQVTTATISGIVTDSTGAVLPGASVVIQNEDTGISRTVQANEAGRYSATSLSVGNYRLTITVAGFQTEVRRGIQLTIGRQAVVNLELQIGAITQTVEVTGEAPLVQTTDSTVGYLVEERTIRELPLNGRDLSQLILLNPAVGEAMNASRTNAYNGWGKKMSISGARAQENAYYLDGSYINDMNRHVPAGPSGALLGAETVREFQVLTNSYSAQYGRVIGGVVTAVSKAGTNTFHGGAYEFHRNDNLDAAKWEDNRVGSEKPPFVRNQFGATFGGPIAKDRTFFFVAYEAMRERLGFTQASIVPDLNARRGLVPIVNEKGIVVGLENVGVTPRIEPYLALFPQPTSGGRVFAKDGTAEFIFQDSEPSTEDFGQGRIDHQFSDSDSFFARFTASNAERIQGDAYPDFRTVRFMGTRLLTLSETHIVSPTMLNTFRASFNRVDPIDRGIYPDVPDSLLSVPGTVVPGLNVGSGITAFDGNTKPFDRWTSNRFNFKDDISLRRGNHALQFGGMIERLQFNMDQPNRPYGEWQFRDLSSFLTLQGSQPIRRLRGTPPQLGSSIRGFRQWYFGLYFQDDWQVTSRLTLNLGVRWEPYTPPDEVNGLLANQRHLLDAAPTVGGPLWKNQSWSDIGPRIGFAWSPFESGTTSVRGGVGLFYIPNDAIVYRTMATRSAPLFPELDIRTAGPLRECFPDALCVHALQPTTFLGTAEAIPFENFKTSHSVQYNLNVQQQLGASNVLTLGYTGGRGMNLITHSGFNAPPGTYNGNSLEIAADATVVNPNFDEILYYAASGDSWYNAMTVAFQRRFSSGFQTQLAYTWAKTISTSDSYSKVDMSGAGPGTARYAHDLRYDRGLSGWHVGQNLKINYSYDLPLGRDWSGVAGHLLGGWQLTGIVSIQDGQPFTVDNATGGTPRELSNLGYLRSPNVISSFTQDQIIQGGPDQYFNPEAFSLPEGDFELGNVGRNTLIGPGLASWDMGLTKNTQLTEQWRLQFRAEIFNLMNRANFAKPSTNVFTSPDSETGEPRTLDNAGQITRTVTTSRQIQFGLKLIF